MENNKKEVKKLHLGTLKGVKKSLSRLANMTLQPDCDLSQIRACVYTLNCLVSCYKIDFEERLVELEKKMEKL